LKIHLWAVCLVVGLELVVAIGVSPSEVTSEHMSRGSVAEQSMFISGLSKGQVVSIEVTGDAADWITFAHGKEFVYPDAPSIELAPVVKVPDDASNGVYKATVVISAVGTTDEGSGTNKVSIIPGVQSRFTITVTGDQVSDYKVSAFKIYNFEQGGLLPFQYQIDNNGNVVAKPEFLSIEIFDMFDEYIISINSTEMTGADPHSKQKLVVYLPNNLAAGQYRAHITMKDSERNFADTVVFDVVTEGFHDSLGNLMLVETPGPVRIGDTVRLTAWFENTGSVPITGNFIGEVYKGSRLLNVAESDSARVLPDEIGSLVAYFEPVEPGTYKVLGHVAFGGKKTALHETKFKVLSEDDVRNRNAAYILLVSVSVVMLVLVILRIKNRKL